MSEISTNLEKMGQHLLSNTPWEESPSSVKWLARLGEEEGELIYSGQVSTGWRHQPVLNLSFSTGWSHQPILNFLGAI